MINLMIEQEDLKKFQFVDKVVNIPDVFGCFLLIHKKTNNFYFGFGAGLQRFIRKTFEHLAKKRHPCTKLQTCNDIHFKFDVYIMSHDNLKQCVKIANSFIEKYSNSTMLMNDKPYEERRYTEFEIQATAYVNLVNAGYIAYGEYIHFLHMLAPRNIRTDIAIFDKEDNLRLILEVKRNSQSKAKAQAIRYHEATGVGVIYIRGMDDARNVVEIVRKELGY